MCCRKGFWHMFWTLACDWNVAWLLEPRNQCIVSQALFVLPNRLLLRYCNGCPVLLTRTTIPFLLWKLFFNWLFFMTEKASRNIIKTVRFFCVRLRCSPYWPPPLPHLLLLVMIYTDCDAQVSRVTYVQGGVTDVFWCYGQRVAGIGPTHVCEPRGSSFEKRCVRQSNRSETGPRLNIKTVLSTYGDFHVKDKTAVRTSYL